jgi:hypothetical protein
VDPTTAIFSRGLVFPWGWLTCAFSGTWLIVIRSMRQLPGTFATDFWNLSSSKTGSTRQGASRSTLPRPPSVGRTGVSDCWHATTPCSERSPSECPATTLSWSSQYLDFIQPPFPRWRWVVGHSRGISTLHNRGINYVCQSHLSYWTECGR